MDGPFSQPTPRRKIILSLQPTHCSLCSCNCCTTAYKEFWCTIYIMNNIIGCFESKIIYWRCIYIYKDVEELLCHKFKFWRSEALLPYTSYYREQAPTADNCSSASTSVEVWQSQHKATYDEVASMTVWCAFLFPSSHNGNNPYLTGNLEKEQVQLKEKENIWLFILFIV